MPLEILNNGYVYYRMEHFVIFSNNTIKKSRTKFNNYYRESKRREK